jgi:hypothetical protein
VPNTHQSSSCNEPVLVDESAKDLRFSQSLRVRIVDRSRHRSQGLWSLLVQSAVRTVLVVVSDVLGQDLLEMTSTENEDPVETLSADGAHEPLGEGVRPRGLSRGLDDADAFRAEHLVEAGRELRVSISDQELGLSGTVGQYEGQVAGLLGDPLPHRIGGDAREVDAGCRSR